MAVEEYMGGYVPFLLAVLCIVAVGISAATLTDASTESVYNPATGPQPIIGDPPGETGEGGQGGGGAVGSGTVSSGYTDFTFCIQLLTNPLVVIGIVVAFGGLIALLSRVLSIAAGVLAGLTLIPPVSVGYFFLTNCQGASVIGAGGGGGGSLARGVAATSPVPPWLAMVLVAGVVVVGAAAVLYRGTGDEEFEGVSAEAEEDESADVADIAEAAGEAADRIEVTAEVDNEVYRAWGEMTDSLDIPNPESATAREFEQRAIEAGMDADDVRELTALFEEVRYGEASVDEVREERAVEILRDIEASYGADESDTDAESESGSDSDSGSGSEPGGDDR